VTVSLARGGAILVAILISVPAIAQSHRPASPPTSQKALDPNQIICEKQEVVGSRLATRRVCRTRAEWADLRLQDRQEIERIQTQRGSCEGRACN